MHAVSLLLLDVSYRYYMCASLFICIKSTMNQATASKLGVVANLGHRIWPYVLEPQSEHLLAIIC